MTLRTPPNDACSQADLDVRESALLAAGFRVDDDNSYAAGFVKDGTRVYLKKTKTPSLAFHPNTPAEDVTRAETASGVTAMPDLYHNTSLARFPERDNGGGPINHGRHARFRSTDEMTAFVGALAGTGA